MINNDECSIPAFLKQISECNIIQENNFHLLILNHCNIIEDN